MSEMTDMDLVREYTRRNSESAFSELIQRHVNLVYSVAMRYVGNSEDAQDVTQAVFIILAKKSAGLRDRTVVSGWLYETTRFTATDFLRAKLRRQIREQEAFMQSTLDDSDTDDVWQKVAPHLEEAMSGLNEKERTLLTLHFFENKTGAETAAALGIEEWAARKRVTRAVEKLRKFFVRRGVGISAGVLAGAIAANSVQAAPATLATSISAAAITKGAAASSSTLTLVKGALKIMAWSKTKTVAVAGAIVLLTGGTSIVGAKIWRAANPPNLIGAWEGSTDIGGSGVSPGETEHSRIVLKIYKTNDAFTAAVDLVDVGIGNIAVNKLVYDYPNIRAEGNLRQMIYFDATMNFTGSKISGTLAQGNRKMPISLNRTSRPASIPSPLSRDEYATPDGGLQGLWEGKYGSWNLSWKIAAQPDGSYRAELDNHQMAEHQPVRVTFNQTNVQLRVVSGSGMFEGKLSHTQLIGDWVQGGLRTPVTFSRVDLPVYSPIPDNEPEVTERVLNLKTEQLRPQDCTPEYWQEFQRTRNPAMEKALPAALGQLQTVTLVERTNHDGRQSYRYRMAYEKMNVIMHIEFEGGKIALMNGAPE